MWNHKNLKATLGLFFYSLQCSHIFLEEILELGFCEQPTTSPTFATLTGK